MRGDTAVILLVTATAGVAALCWRWRRRYRFRRRVVRAVDRMRPVPETCSITFTLVPPFSNIRSLRTCPCTCGWLPSVPSSMTASMDCTGTFAKDDSDAGRYGVFRQGRAELLRCLLGRRWCPVKQYRSWRYICDANLGTGGASSGEGGMRSVLRQQLQEGSSSYQNALGCGDLQVGVIPARYESSRFPGKPLVNILGKPMILRTWERASQAQTLDALVVATDSEDIAQICRQAGAHVVMTSPTCANGGGPFLPPPPTSFPD